MKLDKRERTYEERQQTLIAECKTNLSGLLDVKKADAGMHLVGWLPEGVSDEAIGRKAAEQNLKLAPISAYCAKELPRGGLILGYTAFEKNQIKEGVKRLKAILASEI